MIVNVAVFCPTPAPPPPTKFVKERSMVSLSSTMTSPSSSIGTGSMPTPSGKLIVTGPAVKSVPAIAVLPVNTTSTDSSPVVLLRVTATTPTVLVTSPSGALKVGLVKSKSLSARRRLSSRPSQMSRRGRRDASTRLRERDWERVVSCRSALRKRRAMIASPCKMTEQMRRGVLLGRHVRLLARVSRSGGR